MIVPSLEDVGEDIPPVIQAPALAPPLKVKSIYPDRSKGVKPVFVQNLPLPITPNQPNLLIGMITNVRHQPIVNAILEIKTSAEETVRALKTNKLGQFFTATPLENNLYRLYIEHPDYDFDIITLDAKGEVLSPIKIIGRLKDTREPCPQPK